MKKLLLIDDYVCEVITQEKNCRGCVCSGSYGLSCPSNCDGSKIVFAEGLKKTPEMDNMQSLLSKLYDEVEFLEELPLTTRDGNINNIVDAKIMVLKEILLRIEKFKKM